MASFLGYVLHRQDSYQLSNVQKSATVLMQLQKDKKNEKPTALSTIPIPPTLVYSLVCGGLDVLCEMGMQFSVLEEFM